MHTCMVCSIIEWVLEYAATRQSIRRLHTHTLLSTIYMTRSPASLLDKQSRILLREQF